MDTQLKMYPFVVTYYAKDANDEQPGLVIYSRPQDFATNPDWHYYQLTLQQTEPFEALFEAHVYADVAFERSEDFEEDKLVEFVTWMIRAGVPDHTHEYVTVPAMSPSDPLDQDDFWDIETLGKPVYADDDEPDEDVTPGQHPDGSPNLGRCCACGKEGPDVRNIIALPLRAPVPGTGWGCFVCGLPSNGAVAVLCDDCLDLAEDVRYACVGYAGQNRRLPLRLLAGPFEHIRSRHEPLN